MIKHLRIDNRLIHGQVAVTWMNSIGADKIIVCNDKVAADREGLDKVLGQQYAIDHPEETMFVIAKFPSDALQILESGVEVQDVNVGNAAPIVGTKYEMVTKSIAVTKEDAEIYHKIADLRGGVLISRLTTMNEPDNFLELLQKKGL